MPGHIIRSETVKNLIERDEIWEFDMGGNQTDNKLGWTDQLRKHFVISVSNNNFYGSFLTYSKKLFRTFKKHDEIDFTKTVDL